MIPYSELYNSTKKQMSPSRFQHTLRVVETAIKLSNIHNIDINRAKAAAILHDYCKEWEVNKLSLWIKRSPLSKELRDVNKSLLHGPVAAEVVKDRFNIYDEDLLNAIRYHTFGRMNMSILEKVVFLADYIEPNRRFKGVHLVRELAMKDLDKACLQALDNTIKGLIDRALPIVKMTLSARNYLLSHN